MDGLLEFLLDIIVDGAMGAVDSPRGPLWARILLGAVLLAFFLGLSGLLMAAGFSTGSWGLVALGVLFLGFTAGTAARKLRRRKRK